MAKKAKKKASKKSTEVVEKKSVGRPAGSANKRSLAVESLLKEKGIDVVEKLCEALFPSEEKRQELLDEIREIAGEGGRVNVGDFFLSAKERIDMYFKLMEYVHPKKRSIEVKAEIGGAIDITSMRPDLQNILNSPELFDSIEAICEVVGES